VAMSSALGLGLSPVARGTFGALLGVGSLLLLQYTTGEIPTHHILFLMRLPDT
jgi:hypothetical protein